MRIIIITIFIITAYTASGQKNNPINTYEDLQKEAKDNIRLLPRYGYQHKTIDQINADNEFIQYIRELPDFTTMRAMSDSLVNLGFKYFYRGDLRTAMYRFNQAYLLDSTNSADYWGYGSVYFKLKQYDLATAQYKKGLAIDSLNDKIWTDLATIYLVKLNEFQDNRYLDTAIQFLNTAYKINPTNINATYKLSTAYYRKGSCKLAILYLKETQELGGAPIVKAYTEAVQEHCK